jgi:hypothetical protein
MLARLRSAVAAMKRCPRLLCDALDEVVQIGNIPSGISYALDGSVSISRPEILYETFPLRKRRG